MPAPGSNLQCKDRSKIAQLVLEVLGLRSNGLRAASETQQSTGTSVPRQIALFVKTSAPATNTSGDEPTGKGDLCLVYDGAGGTKSLYRCTVYTSTSVFTWAQIA